MSPATRPLTWPPPTDPQPRWAHHVLHAVADAHQRAWSAHQQLTSLRAELAVHPPAPGQLAARLRAIDNTAVTPHDDVYLHQLLDRHGLDHVTCLLRRAGHYRSEALQTLRHLADIDQRCRLDPALAVARLDQVDDAITTTGRLLVDADHALITTLETTPTPGGDCYPS